jgi:AcrR family transcriptional regulator
MYAVRYTVMNTKKEGRVPKRGRPPKLTREVVAAGALELVDREGLDALSMERLARSLGVGTMTVYGYVDDKDDLLDAIVDAAVADAAPPSEMPAAWREAIELVVQTVHDLLSRHPALVTIRLQRPVLRPEALQFGERIMGLLIGAGFEVEHAASAFRLLFTYVFGFAGLSPQATTEEARQQAAHAVAVLPTGDHPVLTQHAGPFAQAMAGEEAFGFGLNRILDGLETFLRDATRSD